MMNVPSSNMQQAAFSARLDRIQSSHSDCEITLLVGDEKLVGKDPTKKGGRLRRGGQQGFLATLTRLCLSGVIGAGALLAGRLAQFHYLNYHEAGTADDPFYVFATFGGDLAGAIVLIILFSSLFRLKGNLERAVILGSLLAMMFYEPVVISKFPEAYKAAFSPEYVTAALD